VHPADFRRRRRRDHHSRRAVANGRLHPIQQAWIDEQVPQCGFCQNGQMLTAKALLDRTPNPTDAQIRQGMSATLCRCMTYYRIQAAIKRAAKVIAARLGSDSEVNA
jgi:aerobic-type carbon monoxide dehydrogenase small subunit (CoxS/CutS family)